MKKYLFLIISCILYQNINAQVIAPYQNLNVPIPLKEKSKLTNTRAFNEMLIWYGSAENEIYGDTSEFYSRYIWRLHSQATSADSMIKTVSVAFHQLIDELADPNSEILFSDVDEILIDTIWINVGHTNHSGTINQLITSIVTLDNNNRPTDTQLWADTISSDSSFTGGSSWLNSSWLYFTPNQSFGNQPFGVKLEYEGAEQDTFGIIAGFAYDGLCGTGSNEKALESIFATNSFRLYSQYEQDYGVFPTANGADLYYDCNGSGQMDAGDGEHYMQNINIGAKLTIEHSTNLSKIPANNFSLFPNPSNKNIVIDYFLQESSDIIINIYNVDGKTVLKNNITNQNSGSHKINIETLNFIPGLYIVSLSTNKNIINKTLIISQ